MPRSRRAWITILFALTSLALAGAALAAPDFSGNVPTGAGAGTDHKPQSKLWFNDGSWWGIFYDGSTQRIWKLEDTGFVQQTYPDAAVDARAGARCDVLWDGTSLYVLAWHATLPKFSKYDYDAATQTYRRLPGFPVDLPIPGLECMVLDKDSTGRLWVSFEMNQEVHVIWTTSADHLAWDLTGTVIETQIGADDITSTVAFGGNKIGVLWSDQGSDATWRFGFRVHRDGDAPDVWQPIETIDTGSAVDDHMNIKADVDGRLWFAGKNLFNTIQVYTRAPAGGWTQVFHDINRGNCTRPCVEIDETQDAIHVFYTDWVSTPNPIMVVTAPRATGVFGMPQVYLSPGSSSLNDVTGTKQRVSLKTGYAAAASGGSSVYWGVTNLDTDTPVLTALDPAANQAGVSTQPVLQFKITDAGMGVRRSAITLSMDGVPVTPTIAGNAAQYLVSWQPTTPLDPGRIYSAAMTAKDGAFPPHSAAAAFRFKTAFIPGPLAKKINFQPATGASPAGYDIDSGTQYTLDRGLGWAQTVTLKRANSQPDVRLDTYVERKNSSAKAAWSYDLANGVYRIAFAAGAPDAGGKQRVEVEGQVLINNQTTTAGQFINISGYDVIVQDGRLDVKIGGAGGSTKTQLCYFEFTYQGEAPPPPPPGGAAPNAVAHVVIAAAPGNSLNLQWEAVTEDTTGALTAITRYHVYRGSTPAFLPDRAGHSNRVGIVVTTDFTDVGALNAAGEQYYIVTAENAGGLESRHASNLAMRRRVSIDPAGAPSRTLMIALPSVHAWPDAAALVLSMNGSASTGPVTAVASIDRTTQARRQWTHNGGVWSGTNFSILPGDAIEVTVGSALQWNSIGAELSTPTYSFAFHNDVGNVNWLSLPPNAVYTSAQGLAQAVNGTAGLGPVTKVAWMNPVTGRMESWLWFAGAWRGNNFPLPSGQGVAILIGSDVPAWSPQLRQP